MNLAELITTHKGTRSYEALSKDCGGSPRAARLQQLATQPQKNFPDPPSIKALARGLRVPEVVVVLSAAESFGIDVSRATPAILDQLPAGLETLSEVQMRVVADTVRAFVDANKRIDDRRDFNRDAWDRALANRGGYPPGKLGPYLLTVWDEVNDMLYTQAEAEELGVVDGSDDDEDIAPEILIKAAEEMRRRAASAPADPNSVALAARGDAGDGPVNQSTKGG